MIKNFFKIAWRNLVRNKAYSFINILGLAVGMAVVMLIALWIWDELSFDHYHPNHKRVAQIMTTFIDDDMHKETGYPVSMPLGNELRTKYAADFKRVALTSWPTGHSLATGDKKITSTGMWVEPDFPSIFTFRMIAGNRDALTDPSSLLLSASVARALFGSADPMNKTIKVDNTYDFKVAGIYEDPPSNTTLTALFETKFFLPWDKYLTTEGWLKESLTQWKNHNWMLLAEVSDHVDMAKLSEKIKHASMPHRAANEGKEELVLQPMDNFRLYSEFKDGKVSGGRIQFVWLFGIIGIFVLLLACINFMNLSTARSEKRAKEVGIRKTIGSLKSQLIGQFLSESLLFATLSFFCASLLAALLIPFFNQLAGKQMTFPWNNPVFWLLGFGFTVITGLVAGSYPAFYLSKFEPIQILKGTFRVGRYASLPRKVLVVIQFTFSIALIIGTVIVFRQIQFARNRPAGYNRESLITVPMRTPEMFQHFDAIKNDFIASGVVASMARSSSPTTEISTHELGYSWQGKDPNTTPVFGTIYVTEDFGKTIGWQVGEGRDFSKETGPENLQMIVNEATVQFTGLKNIVGQRMQFQGRSYTVVGVVKDMVMESPYEPIKPTVFIYKSDEGRTMTLRIKPGAPIQTALGRIEGILKKYNPGSPFEYVFNDEEYAIRFSDEQRIGKLAAFFTILAIFISCLGLFGLASFVAEQRVKEIGIRKILGASVFSLWQMLSKDFALLIVISCAIAIPIAWYYGNHWLQSYTYKADISWWIFFLACAGALALTLITVSYQAIRAALSNPVKSLRSE